MEPDAMKDRGYDFYLDIPGINIVNASLDIYVIEKYQTIGMFDPKGN